VTPWFLSIWTPNAASWPALCSTLTTRWTNSTSFPISSWSTTTWGTTSMMTPVEMNWVIVLPAKSRTVTGMSDPLWTRPCCPLRTTTLGVEIVRPSPFVSKSRKIRLSSAMSTMSGPSMSAEIDSKNDWVRRKRRRRPSAFWPPCPPPCWPPYWDPNTELQSDPTSRSRVRFVWKMIASTRTSRSVARGASASAAGPDAGAAPPSATMSACSMR